MDDRVEKFLEELSELTKKYNVAISGCGCCSSPYLDVEADLNKNYGNGDLSWDASLQKYTY